MNQMCVIHTFDYISLHFSLVTCMLQRVSIRTRLLTRAHLVAFVDYEIVYA